MKIEIEIDDMKLVSVNFPGLLRLLFPPYGPGSWHFQEGQRLTLTASLGDQIVSETITVSPPEDDSDDL